MATSPDRAIILVSSSTARNLEFYDAVTHARLEKIDDLLAEPHEITFDPRRRRGYVTHTYRAGAYGEENEKGHEISVIDVDGRRIEKVIDIAPYMGPHDVEYDSANDLIYTGVEDVDGNKGIVIIDADTLNIVANVPLAAANAHWLAVTPSGEIYVTHKEAEVISVVDPVKREIIGSVAVPGGAEEIDADPRGGFVYALTPKIQYDVGGPGQYFRHPVASDEPPPRLVKIDTRTREIVGEVEFQDYNSGIRVTSDGRILITHMRFSDHGEVRPPGARPGPPNGELIVVDGESMAIEGRVDVGPMPITVRASPDSVTAWVSNLASGTVTVVDLTLLVAVNELHNNSGKGYGGTHGLTYVPAATATSPSARTGDRSRDT